MIVREVFSVVNNVFSVLANNENLIKFLKEIVSASPKN